MWGRLIGVLASGVVFGAAATWLNVPPEDHVLDASARRVASLVVNAGVAWAGIAVLGGWLSGSGRRGLLGGPLALVPAVGVYYLLGAAIGSENPDGSPDQILFFGLLALLTGFLLGAVGGRARRQDVVGLVAALVLPVGVGLELGWRASGLVVPDPARPFANAVLVLLALTGATAAVLRHVRAGRRPAGQPAP